MDRMVAFILHTFKFENIENERTSVNFMHRWLCVAMAHRLGSLQMHTTFQSWFHFAIVIFSAVFFQLQQFGLDYHSIHNHTDSLFPNNIFIDVDFYFLPSSDNIVLIFKDEIFNCHFCCFLCWSFVGLARYALNLTGLFVIRVCVWVSNGSWWLYKFIYL